MKGKRKKHLRPDDSFNFGPVRVARFGSNVVHTVDWSPEDFANMQVRAAADFERIVSEIDAGVTRIAERVQSLPPLKLLHRAWWDLAARTLYTETEADVGQDDAVAMRMVDYIQSVVASVPPLPDQSTELSDENWRDLRADVQKLFELVNGPYQISLSIKRKLENEPTYSEQAEEFRFRSQVYWANVRGQRHYANQMIALEDLIEIQSDILEECFGLNAKKILSEFEKIWRAQIFGVGEALAELEAARNATNQAVNAELENADSASDIRSVADIMTAHGIGISAESAARRFFGYDLFDLQIVTNLPTSFLDIFSWGPGADTAFFAEGSMRGWPLRIWPSFKRPFIKLEGRYYCFDLHSLFDHAFRVLEKAVFQKRPDLKEVWIANRTQRSEELSRLYLSRILHGASEYGQIYYPNGPKKSDGWSELDGLISFDDHLFVIEVKGGSYTYTSPADDFDAHISSLKALLESPARQASRFLRHLESSPEVSLFDISRNEMGRIRRSDYRHITILAVSVDPFTEFAAQARHLTGLGLTGVESPIWSLSIDDLRVFSQVFDTPIEFLHFVEQRMLAHKSNELRLDDELDHLGMYLEHNNYALHAEKTVSGSGARFSVFGYRSDLDRFYNDRLKDPDQQSPLGQKMPSRMRETLKFLSRISKPGRTAFGSYLLDLDGTAREELFASLEVQLERARTGQTPQAFSTYGEVRLSLVPATPPFVVQDKRAAVELARAIIAMHDEPNRMLYQPTYLNASTLIGMDWTLITNSVLSQAERERLQLNSAHLRKQRLQRDASKTSRNDLCPCGSGRKYKKCCLQ
jgi:hypothetical protein